MKKSLIAMAAMLAFGAAQAEYIDARSVNSNRVSSGSGAFASSAGNGASISAAGNSQTASSSSDASATKYTTGGWLAGSKGGLVTVGGTTSGTTLSAAGNLSVGNATGFAYAGGKSQAESDGSAMFDQHGSAPQADVRGGSTSVADSAVFAGRNGAGVAGGANVGAYGAAAGATQSWLFGGAVKKNTATTVAGATNASLSNQAAIGNAEVGTKVWGETGAMANAASGNLVSFDN